MFIRHQTHARETIDIVPQKCHPLAYADLVTDYKDRDKRYPIQIEASSIVSNETAGKPKGPATVSMPIAFREPVSIFALVDGGWLPPPFVTPANFLVDRNVVASFVRIRQRVAGSDLKQGDWWFEFFREFAVLINPAPYALEGNKQRAPSFDEFRLAFEEASLEISKQLPGAKLVQYEDIHFKAAFALITDSADRLERETEFLVRTIPLVAHRVSDSRLEKVRAQILSTAKQLRLKTHSLAPLAVLSCLYEKVDGSGFLAARKLLKPGTTYTRKAAYNALSDLRAVEMFMASLGFNREPFAFCTCDRAIAAFWCGLNGHDSHWENERPSFTVSLTEDLFPRLGESARENLALELAA